MTPADRCEIIDMTPARIQEIGNNWGRINGYGLDWQSPLARHLGIHRETIRRALIGTYLTDRTAELFVDLRKSMKGSKGK